MDNSVAEHFISKSAHLLISTFAHFFTIIAPENSLRMGLFSFIGGRSKIIELIHRGAVIIDVRPAYAFDQHGRIPDSINIPLDRIAINIERIRSMKRPVVLCCAYGTDCEKAARMLKEKGVKDVYNGGNWQSILKRL